jgi:hypothetical protein
MVTRLCKAGIVIVRSFDCGEPQLSKTYRVDRGASQYFMVDNIQDGYVKGGASLYGDCMELDCMEKIHVAHRCLPIWLNI